MSVGNVGVGEVLVSFQVSLHVIQPASFIADHLWQNVVIQFGFARQPVLCDGTFLLASTFLPVNAVTTLTRLSQTVQVGYSTEQITWIRL
jgi:hypothetical protein